MKKLFVVMAIMMVAGVTQASMINWLVQNKTLSNPVGTGYVPVGTQVVLFLWDNQASIVSEIEAGHAITTSTAGVLDMGNTTNIKGYYAGGTVTNSQMKPAGKLETFGLLAFYAEGGVNTRYIMASLKEYTYDSTSTDINVADPVEAIFTATTFEGASWVTISAVPEPTSLALLALGVAALGLKRKIR